MTGTLHQKRYVNEFRGSLETEVIRRKFIPVVFKD